MSQNIVALIPARGGSKGLPRKNILQLNNKPLIQYTLDAALKADIFNRIYVSSDCEEILQISTQGGVTTIKRPEHLAEDGTSMNLVIKHLIDAKNLSSETIVVLLQPTSPCRNHIHIREAWQLYNTERVNMVVSGGEPDNTPFKAYGVDQNRRLFGYFGKDAPYQRRQDFPKTFFANGAIYIFSVRSFLAQNRLPTENIVGYNMGRLESVDVDSADDLTLVSAIMQNKVMDV